MSKSAAKAYDASSVIAHFERVNREHQKWGKLPVHYEIDGDTLRLFGTNNIGECDRHNVLRIEEGALCYKGPIEVQAHLSDLTLKSIGAESDIRVTGYLSGQSAEHPVKVVSEKACVILGDPDHPERKLVLFAHIEAGEGVNIYKRQLIHTTIINHAEDAVIRGQNLQNVHLESPSANIAASNCKHSTIKTTGDVMIKASEVIHSHIQAKNGDVYLCAGEIRNCIIEAKYDIELNGHVDAYTLQHARSSQGKVRHDGEIVNQRRSAKAEKKVVALPRKAAIKAKSRKISSAR